MRKYINHQGRTGESLQSYIKAKYIGEGFFAKSSELNRADLFLPFRVMKNQLFKQVFLQT